MSVTTDDVLSVEIGFQAKAADHGLSVHETIKCYHNSLLRFLRQRLRVKEDAADVAQEAYVRLLQYEGSKSIASPSSMLFRIAINVANDLSRSRTTRRVADEQSIEDVELASDEPDVERRIAAEQDLDALYAAIEALPPKCKNVFLLSRVKRMSYPEIAQHCGISVKMVEKHISHALKICAQKVGGYSRSAS
jgi:RNA polymerase sigma factor (sigma-70 family)